MKTHGPCARCGKPSDRKDANGKGYTICTTCEPKKVSPLQRASYEATKAATAARRAKESRVSKTRPILPERPRVTIYELIEWVRVERGMLTLPSPRGRAYDMIVPTGAGPDRIGSVVRAWVRDVEDNRHLLARVVA